MSQEYAFLQISTVQSCLASYDKLTVFRLVNSIHVFWMPCSLGTFYSLWMIIRWVHVLSRWLPLKARYPNLLFSSRRRGGEKKWIHAFLKSIGAKVNKTSTTGIRTRCIHPTYGINNHYIWVNIRPLNTSTLHINFGYLHLILNYYRAKLDTRICSLGHLHKH